MGTMRNVVLACFILSLGTPWNFGQDAVTKVRGQLADLGKLTILREAGKLPHNPLLKRDPDSEITFQLRQVPDEILLTAVDQGLRTGSRDERLGAATVYTELLGIDLWKRRKLLPIPEYKAILLELLEKDDLTLPCYTRSIAFPLQYYPSREVVIAWMSAAQRTPVPLLREHLVIYASDLIGMHLELDSTRPLEKEMLLSGFETWFAANKDKIQFDKHGRYHLAGKEIRAKNNELTVEDRGRIRKDPVCVIRLFDNGMGGDASHGQSLGQTCGVALLGPDAGKLLDTLSPDKASASIELKAAIGSARYTYPIFNAVALASIYVAAYERDAQSIALAKAILGQLPALDLDRIIKGEPKEVRKKAKELEAELFKNRGD
jgi:hypothetical protein